jgi:hypothetical protein
MRKALVFLTAAASLAAVPALAQPTPGEQAGMHIGTTVTNGSSTIVTDQYGTHPEGYPGFSPINRGMTERNPPPPRRHHYHHFRDVEGR